MDISIHEFAIAIVILIITNRIIIIIYQYAIFSDLLTMPKQIFISHSKNDNEIVDYFIHKFNDTGVKPVIMEYEKWSREGRPNWMWIRDEIQKSKALFSYNNKVP